GRELLTDLGVGQDVDGRDRRAGVAQRAKRTIRVAAHHELRRAFHEECHRLVFDHVLDPTGKLAHAVPFVLILSSWMVPSRSGPASASLTSRYCSSSGRPAKAGLATIT